MVLTPFYLLVLYFFAKRYRNKHYGYNHPLRKYYLPGLLAKFAGVIFIALVYQYYYHGGDTFNYFVHARTINSALDESFSTWFDVLLRRSPEVNPMVYRYSSQMYWYIDQSAYAVSRIGALLGLLNGTTYIPIGLLMAYFTYTGIWAMYRTFVKIYPRLYKQLAWAFLFIPSTVVWGSSLFKDSICMFGLGWLTTTVFRIFVDRNFTLKNIALMVLSFYLLAVIKVYIIMAFLPALSLWLLLTYSNRIKNIGVRIFSILLFIGILAGGFLFIANSFAKELDEYAIDNIAHKAKKTQTWINYVSDIQDGSAYNIGTLDGTLPNMLSKFPQSVNVTLYRPYLWEARKPIIFLSAVEASLFLILTLMVFYRIGFKKTFGNIIKDPNLLFFLCFTIIFAFAIGISTGNFGTLSRYKIPCLPFFAALLLILYYQAKTQLPVTQKALHAKKPVTNFARL